jgi:hypothetical protein
VPVTHAEPDAELPCVLFIVGIDPLERQRGDGAACEIGDDVNPDG